MNKLNLPSSKKGYHFRVLFNTVMGILDETSKALSMCLLSVSTFGENDNTYGLLFGDDVIFTFMDDMEDTVYDGIQILKNSKELQIDLQYLDGNDNVLRTFRFEEPNIGMVQFSPLDYGDDTRLVIKMPVSFTKLTKIKP
jgi:hypothetical protein